MARVHRQISESGPQFQDPSPQEAAATAPLPPRQFLPPAIKGTRPVPQSPTFQQPSLPPPRSDAIRPSSLSLQRPLIRPTSQPPSPFSPPSVQQQQSPHEFPASVSPSQTDSFQRTPTENLPDPYLQSPQTPRPQFAAGQQSPSGQRISKSRITQANSHDVLYMRFIAICQITNRDCRQIHTRKRHPRRVHNLLRRVPSRLSSNRKDPKRQQTTPT